MCRSEIWHGGRKVGEQMSEYHLGQPAPLPLSLACYYIAESPTHINLYVGFLTSSSIIFSRVPHTRTPSYKRAIFTSNVSPPPGDLTSPKDPRSRTAFLTHHTPEVPYSSLHHAKTSISAASRILESRKTYLAPPPLNIISSQPQSCKKPKGPDTDLRIGKGSGKKKKFIV